MKSRASTYNKNMSKEQHYNYLNVNCINIINAQIIYIAYNMYISMTMYNMYKVNNYELLLKFSYCY